MNDEPTGWKGGPQEEPGLVDMLSGKVFAMDRSLWQAVEDVVTFRRVPVYDSVVLTAERAALPLETRPRRR
jgi:hypothetical protein